RMLFCFKLCQTYFHEIIFLFNCININDIFCFSKENKSDIFWRFNNTGRCTMEGSGDKYEFIGAGIGGNKVYDLYLRMEDDVLAKSPDVVIVYIGVNDVWHKSTSGTGTDPDKFEKFYQAIIDKLKAKNIKIILSTPAAIGEKTDFSNPQDGDMNEYSNIIRRIASKNGLPVVDLRKSFLDYNLKNNPENKDRGILTTDRVHLNANGNQLVADEMWRVIKSL